MKHVINDPADNSRETVNKRQLMLSCLCVASRWDSGQQITFSFISFSFLLLLFPLGKYTNIRGVSSELILLPLMLFPCPALLSGWVRTAAADSVRYRIPSAVSLSVYTLPRSLGYIQMCMCVCVCDCVLLLLLAEHIPLLRLYRLLLSAIFLYLSHSLHPSPSHNLLLSNAELTHTT